MPTVSKGPVRDDHAAVNAHRVLLVDRDVKGWYDELAQSNEGTAEDNLRRLYRYCRAIGMTPAQIVARAMNADGGRRAVERRLSEFMGLLKKPHKPVDHAQPMNVRGADTAKCGRGHPDSYAGNYNKTLRSWLRYHDILLRRLNVGDYDAAPTLEGVPYLTKQQVRTAVRAAKDPRAKVIITCDAWTGIRPEVLGKRDGSIGLVLGDFPEMGLKDGVVAFPRFPTLVIVRRRLSKINRQELKFLGAEGCTYLKEYLEQRALRGEELALDTPVIRSDRYATRRFMETQRLTGIVRETFRAVGIPNRPYDLRNFFVDALAAAEHDGKIGHVDKEFFIGRRREIDLRYTRHRVVSPEAVEQLRTTYKACESYLGARAGSIPSESPDIAALASTIADEVRAEVQKQLYPDIVRTSSAWETNDETRAIRKKMAELEAQMALVVDQLYRSLQVKS